MDSLRFNPAATFRCWLILLTSTAMVHAQGDKASASSTNIATFAKLNPGLYVNSRFDETKPMISADGRILYFARKNAPGNVGGKADPQDIYFSQTRDGIHWTKAKNTGRELNSRFADNLCAIENSGAFIFFVPSGKHRGNFIRRGTIPGDSSFVTGPVVINESEYLEATFSIDRSIVMYTAKTKKNLAYRRDVDERDIYFSRKIDGQWTDPVNLGVVINSLGDEYSPFLAADMKTLYFATNGRAGFGGVDIYMSKRLDETWTNWSDPVNLGPGVNSNAFDGYMTVSALSGMAYFVSHKQTLGKGDIISTQLPEPLAPKRMMVWKARAQNVQTGVPMAAKVELRDANGNLLAEGVSDALTGEIGLLIFPSQTFSITASSDGFETFHKTVYVGQQSIDLLELQPIPRTRKILLEPVHFEKGSDQFTHSSSIPLERLVQVMREYPASTIELLGHTDNVGSFSALKRLSEMRVRAVTEYLLLNGISRQRIGGNGFGASRPVRKNDNEENRMKNRRVELVLKLSTG